MVSDAHQANLDWSAVPMPDDLSDLELVIAAGILELLASRKGAAAPDWVNRVGTAVESVVLDPGLERMPRSFAKAKSDGPEPLRRRNLVAMPDFLDVA
jgi:hypothetical protein